MTITLTTQDLQNMLDKAAIKAVRLVVSHEKELKTKQWLTKAEAAEFIGRHANTIDNLYNKFRIDDNGKSGHDRRFSKKSINEYLSGKR